MSYLLSQNTLPQRPIALGTIVTISSLPGPQPPRSSIQKHFFTERHCFSDFSKHLNFMLLVQHINFPWAADAQTVFCAVQLQHWQCSSLLAGIGNEQLQQLCDLEIQQHLRQKQARRFSTMVPSFSSLQQLQADSESTQVRQDVL